MALWLAAAGMLGSGIASRKARKAAEQQAQAILAASQKAQQQMGEMAAPWIEQGKFSLPKIRDLIMNRYAPAIGKDSPLLSAASEKALAGLMRREEQEKAGSERYWTATGNIGRGRGEQMRIAQAAQESKGDQMLQAAGMQEQYRSGMDDRYMQALSGLAGQGQVGLGAGLGAIETGLKGTLSAAEARGAGKMGAYSDMAGMFGAMTGYGMERESNKQLLEWLKSQQKIK